MSQLGDLENALVTRLTAATLAGSPVFQTVRGVSGGFRPAIREAIRRERMPAAYVAFTDEPTAPEVKTAVRGSRFVVLVADRALRVESDPRHGDVNSLGAFTSLEQARLELDGYEPVGGLRLLNLHQKFVEADDRVAVYELLYRVWPVPPEVLAPAAPSFLQAFAGDSDDEVRLTWQAPVESDKAGKQDYYRIYRKLPSDSEFILHETTSKDDTEKTLTGQPSAVVLQYHITAANTGGEGSASNTVMVFL